MKLSFYILFSLVLLQSCAQQSQNRKSNKNLGLQRTKKIEYYDEVNEQGKSPIKSITHYLDGKKDSVYLEYRPNGALKKVGMYEDGKKEGMWSFYTSTMFGTQREDIHSYYEKGVLVKEHDIVYYPDSKIIVYEMVTIYNGDYFKAPNGEEFNLEIKYYKKDGRYYGYNLKNTANERIYGIDFHEDGSKETYYMIIGDRDGPYKYWNKDGKLEIEREYENDKVMKEIRH